MGTMEAEDVKTRLGAIGRSRQWLAKRTGYEPQTLYNAITNNKFPARLSEAIERALSTEEAGSIQAAIAEFTDEERAEIAQHAKNEGFATGNQWLVAKVRALLAMMRAGPKD
jgi:hypothetical protein